MLIGVSRVMRMRRRIWFLRGGTIARPVEPVCVVLRFSRIGIACVGLFQEELLVPVVGVQGFIKSPPPWVP